MNKYYVLERGSEFKTIFMDAATGELWVKAGWELGTYPYESQYEAQLAMERWKVVATENGQVHRGAKPELRDLDIVANPLKVSMLEDIWGDMRVFTIFPPIHAKNTYAPELRELLSNGQVKPYVNSQNDGDPLCKLFADVQSSSLKEIAKKQTNELTRSETRALVDFKAKLFEGIREIAEVKAEEQFWVVVTCETDFLFSGAALGAS